MLENININELISTYIIPFSIKIFFAILIFIVGRIVVKAIIGLLRKILAKAKMDVILVNFVSSIVKTVLLLFVVVAALDQLGVNTSSLIALVGAAGLAIGLALQGSLQNFAAGVMMIIFRPFKSGDFIEAGGVTGVVEMISIFSTTLRTGDNREIIIPNGSIYSSAITNYSARETRRIDMVFGIGYEDNMKQAKQIMQTILDADDRILKDPKTLIAVSELADSSVNFVVRPWVKSDDYWAVKFDITEKIKEAFDDDNISIPYPQLDLHMNKVD